MLPNGTKLNSLFYADDLIILSRSKLGLQNCLNKLSSYCNSWMLKINPKKTKIMVFQKGTKKCDYVFHVGNEMIDIVKDYTYLGLVCALMLRRQIHLPSFTSYFCSCPLSKNLTLLQCLHVSVHLFHL